jgi:hypothetical protein
MHGFYQTNDERSCDIIFLHFDNGAQTQKFGSICGDTRDQDKIKVGASNIPISGHVQMSRAHTVFFSTPMPTVICTPYFRRFNALLNFSRQLHTQKHAVHVAECPSNAAQPLRLLLVGSPVSITAYQDKNLDKTDKMRM